MDREELARLLPKDGFFKVSQSRAVQMPAAQRAALIRKGNALFNQKQYELARRVFLTAGYSDGLIRLGDLYMKQNKPLDAFRMYWLAPEPNKIDALMEGTVAVLRKWLKEER